MKLSGRYMKYRTIALGLNPENGDLMIFPSLAIGSLPAFSCLPSLTMLVASLETRVPSKVSSRASWRRKFRDRTEMIVELSLRMRITVVKTASGPFTKTSTASCGTYVKANMEATTPTERPIVGRSRESNGFHSDR